MFFPLYCNLTKHLPELKSKNNSIKSIAKECIANIKLLIFILLSNFNNFYNLIVNKFLVNLNFLYILKKIKSGGKFLIRQSGIIQML